MKTKGNFEPFRNVENKTITRFLIIVLIVLGASFFICGIIIPEIAWVLLICFFYILALEAILLTSN
jgi:uncharacterized membrane protein